MKKLYSRFTHAKNIQDAGRFCPRLTVKENDSAAVPSSQLNLLKLRHPHPQRESRVRPAVSCPSCGMLRSGLNRAAGGRNLRPQPAYPPAHTAAGTDSDEDERRDLSAFSVRMHVKTELRSG